MRTFAQNMTDYAFLAKSGAELDAIAQFADQQFRAALPTNPADLATWQSLFWGSIGYQAPPPMPPPPVLSSPPPAPVYEETGLRGGALIAGAPARRA